MEKQLRLLAAAALCGAAFFLLLVDASVHDYSHGRFEAQGNAFVYFGGSEGLYASAPRSAKSGLANGRSYIRFDQSLVFRRKAAGGSGHFIQALAFDVADRDDLGGSAFVGRLDLCCSADLAREVGCKEGEIIYRNSTDNPSSPRVVRVEFDESSTQARMPVEEIVITKTGMYLLYFVHCDPALEAAEVTGKTVWKNPSGYLPGRMTPLVPFYALMSVAYLALGLVWLVQYTRFWRDILQLQNCITLVIGLGMAEMATWYFDYVNFNATGKRPVGITLWAVTIGAVKKTLSRILVLIVSMGYGVVQPTLGGLTSKVLFLGGTFFVASECLDVVEHVGRIDEISYRVKLLLVLPVAVLDAFFILWIFTSLSRTLEKLQVKKQSAKLDLYRKFTNSLAIAVLVAVAWIGFELYFKASDSDGKHWSSAWIISAFWNVLTFCILCVICALWAPSHNSTRYAYSEEISDEGDEESIPLTASKMTIPPEAVGANIKPERKEKKIVSSDVFRLDEDSEQQDKRE
ncbi:hypothetical protein SELMODRAFT_182621 [Selaginella moellendorffii]|uniref:GOST seven transmembrane domain-containing protein n=1 Tax=Selaginella moellendorffii TaxID=88036 RepID=D8STW4_SELML|nr:transmembrane protein 87B [Selaginella moellendorffii]EFJ12095.1 hypothetical protein SELMODRAFT_182621 [Selaginella moellendorffii]|eukprot:XP_002986765.1 transmembrane protein 87B [Selaginella moellendorffii]